MYHRFKFEPDPTSIKHFSRPRKVQAQYSAYIVNRPVHFIIPIIHIPRCIPYISERTYIESKSRDLSSNSIYPPSI